MNPGWPHSVDCSRTSGRSRSASSATASGCSGTGRAAAAGDVCGRRAGRDDGQVAHPLEQLAPQVEHGAGQLAGLARVPVEVGGRAPGGSQERLEADRQPRLEAADTPDREQVPGTNASREVVSWRSESVWPRAPRITSWWATRPGQADAVDGDVAAEPGGRRESGARRRVALRARRGARRSRPRPCAAGACSAKRIRSTAPIAKLGADRMRHAGLRRPSPPAARGRPG